VINTVTKNFVCFPSLLPGATIPVLLVVCNTTLPPREILLGEGFHAGLPKPGHAARAAVSGKRNRRRRAIAFFVVVHHERFTGYDYPVFTRERSGADGGIRTPTDRLEACRAKPLNTTPAIYIRACIAYKLCTSTGRSRDLPEFQQFHSHRQITYGAHGENRTHDLRLTKTLHCHCATRAIQNAMVGCLSQLSGFAQVRWRYLPVTLRGSHPNTV
jgi:hypothetical protein